jgi:ketosteroid isomerase-like protein
MLFTTLIRTSIVTAALGLSGVAASAENAAEVVARMDTEYQAAVERNDWKAMDRILHPDFVLVLGDGTRYTRAQLIDSAKNQAILYDRQVEVAGTQSVRMYGEDTATVTALLELKGTRSKDRSPIDFKLWFTDTYVRTGDGWRYAFGQAGTPIK